MKCRCAQNGPPLTRQSETIQAKGLEAEAARVVPHYSAS